MINGRGKWRAGLLFGMALLLSVTTGCGSVPPPDGGQPPASTSSDPRSFVGRSHVELGPGQIRPVTDNPQPKLPVTLTDMQGTKVTVRSTDRILALDLYGSLSRIVFELGLGDRLVGRDISSSYPEAKRLPLVTVNGHQLEAESILALNPTLIITDTSLGPWDVILQMRDAGIPVVVVDSHRNMDNIGSLIKEVAVATGVPDEGRQLADRVQKEVDGAVAKISEIAPARVQDKPRTIFLYVRGTAGIYYMFGKGSGADALITALGAYDVSSEIDWSGMKPVNDEGIIAAQPDVILMMTKGLESVGGVDGLIKAIPAIGLTPAGKKKRIIDMPDTEILSFGPRTADVLDALSTALYHPDELAPVDPAAAPSGSGEPAVELPAMSSGAGG